MADTRQGLSGEVGTDGGPVVHVTYVMDHGGRLALDSR